MEREISKLLERPDRNRFHKLLGVLSKDLLRKSIAKKIFQLSKSTDHPVYSKELRISSYDGENETAAKIAAYLSSRSHPAIKAAILHGSIASNEVTAFSDFDGILLVDCRRFENEYSVESLLEIIERTSKMMLQQDALQHHGWMVLTTDDLGNYPSAEIPLHLLEDGKLIYPEREISLLYNEPAQAADYKKQFLSLTDSLLRKCTDPSSISSFYRFKLLISQFLLLPALYFQAKENNVIRKKESFRRINEMPSRSAVFINEISRLRSSWNQDEAVTGNGILKSSAIPERYKSFLDKSKLSEAIVIINELKKSAGLREEL